MRQPTKRSLVAGLIIAALCVVPVIVAASAVGASPKAATGSELFHGPIEKVTTSRSFKMNDLLAHGGKGRTRKIKVTDATTYEHLSGFSALHKGLNVDVTSHEHVGGHWTADKIRKAPASPIPSGVTIHFRKKFVGFVFSKDPRICASGRPVKVYRQKGNKQRPGRDFKIQKRTFATKQPNGKYKWVLGPKQIPGPGEYYARIGKFADCQKDSSKTIHAP